LTYQETLLLFGRKRKRKGEWKFIYGERGIVDNLFPNFIYKRYNKNVC